jgi:dihydropteroate synthase
VTFAEISMPGLYLEPIGLLYGPVAREAVTLGSALPLAGGSIAFGAVRLWEGEPGNIKHAVVRTNTIQAIDDPRVKELLDRIVSPRAPIAAISMDSPRVMGIVNVTPDSFSDGGDHYDSRAAVRHAASLVSEGADLIDIGGESTRPGSEPVSVEEELRRVMPVLQELRGCPIPISIDTRKPEVMRQAVEAGAAMINDVSALTFSRDSCGIAASLGKPVILMHSKGDPKTMQDNPSYRDVVIEVYDFLESRIEAAVAAGVPRNQLIVDPGIGFGKSAAHNLSLLQSISLFHGLGAAVLTGTSRKRFIGKHGGTQEPKERVGASIAAALDCVSQGVQMVRVHDIGATRQALSFWKSLRGLEAFTGEASQLDVNKAESAR